MGISSLDSILGVPQPNIAEAVGRVRGGKLIRGVSSPSSKHIACLSLARRNGRLSRGCGRGCFGRLLPCLSTVSSARTSYVVQAVRGFCSVVYREDVRGSEWGY